MVEETRTAGGVTYVLTVKQVKNINLRVKADGSVAVSAGRRVPKGEVDRFVLSRAGWILAHMEKMRARLEAPNPDVPEKRDAEPVLGESLERVYPMVEALGIEKPVLKGRKMKSRWGSCHFTKGTVVLNTALAALPEELVDYVTLHELVHFLHHDHGKGFYAALSALMPDWKARRQRLRGYEGMLK
ncbi:MAG: M48 family peptidase [Clostridia bacterium]|nr:M48 family peptidase [Clostridia bacterium]